MDKDIDLYFPNLAENAFNYNNFWKIEYDISNFDFD